MVTKGARITLRAIREVDNEKVQFFINALEEDY